MSKRRQITLAIFAAICLLLVVGGFWLYHALQHVPDFYAKAISNQSPNQREASREMTRQTAALVSQAKKRGDWQAIFTLEQINSWLAVDLVEQFPQDIPAGVNEPRIALHDNTISVGCRYEKSGVSSVVWLEVEPRLRKKNELAIRIRHARAGDVPLPLRQGIDAVSKSAREAGLIIEESQIDGDPLLIVTAVPDGKFRQITLESLEIRDDAIVIGGHTEIK